MSGTELVRRAVAAMNRQDPAGYAATYSADAVVYDPLEPPAKGRGAIERSLADYLGAFPDLHGTIEGVIEDGDRVAFEVTLTGTNTGALTLPDGVIPPTGRRTHVRLCGVVTIGADGLAVESRRYYDTADLLDQLGLLG